MKIMKLLREEILHQIDTFSVINIPVTGSIIRIKEKVIKKDARFNTI